MAREGREATKAQFDKLVALVRKSPGNSERWFSEQSGIDMGIIGKSLWRAEVIADPSLKIAATPKAIYNAAQKGNLRWPRIAAYAGITVGEARRLYEQAGNGAAPSNLTARGRQFDGVTTVKKTGGSGRRGAAAAKAQPSGTSGRRGAAKQQPAKATASTTGRRAAGRRGTRASASPK